MNFNMEIYEKYSKTLYSLKYRKRGVFQNLLNNLNTIKY